MTDSIRLPDDSGNTGKRLLAKLWNIVNDYYIQGFMGSNWFVVDGVALEVKSAKIDTVGASGLTDVVAAVATKKIRVLAIDFSASADVDVSWKDDTPTVLRPARSFGATGGMAFNYAPGFAFETAAGKKLQISLSVAAQVTGTVNYVEV